MVVLKEALAAWGSPAFEVILKAEIEQLDIEELPLQQGLSRGNYTDGKNRSAMIIGVVDDARRIRAKVGIFYSAIIAGCSCADDPTPVDELAEYCELQFDIDKATAETAVTLLS